MITDRNRVLNEICIQDAIITFTDIEYERIKGRIDPFVEAMKNKDQSPEHYVNERGAPSYKVIKDIVNGKWGEFFALKFFVIMLKFPMCNVDLEIRSGAGKGWSPDLPFSIVDKSLPNIHVKTCDEDLCKYVGDYSWTFQKKNRNGIGGQDVLYTNTNSMDIVACVCIQSFKQAVVKITAPWKTINEGKFLRNPKSDCYKGYKECLYYKDFVVFTILSEKIRRADELRK